MSQKIASIYAPSLYWFAYQYHRGLVTSSEGTTAKILGGINPQWVRNQYDRILKKFEVDLELDIRQDESAQDFDLLRGSDDERAIAFFTTPQHLEGFIYPQSLHDSYALNFNIYHPESRGKKEYKLEDLAKFNPENCFKPEPEFASNLGQTLLLSGYLNTTAPENIRDLEPLAKQCWIKFFHLENGKPLPPLYRAYNLFGGYLYEYGSPKANLEKNPYGHLLIWFLFEEYPTLMLQKCYWELPELLLYYHKISKSFQDSRMYYEGVDRLVTHYETTLNPAIQTYLNLQKKSPFSATELQNLKTTLKILLKTSLNYTKELRNLEYAHNTIAINSKNYQTSLERMEQQAQRGMEGLRLFHDKEAIAFQEQIRADLNYFYPGSNLLNEAIATIRGLVEIDQAERDRHLEQQIQTVGTAIAFGALVASLSPLLFDHSMTFPWQEQHGDRLHPFIIAVLLSIAAAALVWVVARLIRWRWNRR
ncbi:hypothetical protein [Laspinema olomoucense]|uniref:hypothetical protein n=1 Tax=Laspinema olomoucense TaxID=3231600 RepID=UPI0021BA6F8D|nr:hypothetical protein [Laspinema sp. D3d]MCT7972691.1 hypothetical protein [Laspinema sp. D3d]